MNCTLYVRHLATEALVIIDAVWDGHTSRAPNKYSEERDYNKHEKKKTINVYLRQHIPRYTAGSSVHLSGCVKVSST